MRLARYLFISIATLLLPQAALAQSADAQAAAMAQQAGAAADKGEEAAKAECKAKSDPSILVNYWKTAAGAGCLRLQRWRQQHGRQQ